MDLFLYTLKHTCIIIKLFYKKRHSPLNMLVLKSPSLRMMASLIYIVTIGCLAEEAAINKIDINDGPTFNQLVNQHQKQAKAIVKQAGKKLDNHNGTQHLISDDAVAHEMQRQKNMNQAVVTKVGENEINQARASLPQLGVIGNRLKYGSHHTVSQNGEEIIDLIRSLIQAPSTQQNSILSKLQVFAKNNVPEALHFFGFIFEYGLFGADKNLSKAVQYYQSAASFNYQPALYNLAIMSAYGRSGKVDLEKSRRLIRQAYALGNESSYRVCGFASFLSYRFDLQNEAQRYAHRCVSPLANLSLATQNNELPLAKRVSLLRDSLATGVDDAYRLIVRITQPFKATDNNYTFCKYALVDRYRNKTTFNRLQDDALRCVAQAKNFAYTDSKNKLLYDQIIRGIAGFVPVEINALAHIRRSNPFHYNWSVPYLPFGQQEVNLFSSMINL